MKFTAVGDILPQRRMAENYDGFKAIKDFIEKGDGRFFNLETTVNREGECFGSQFSGGTYIRCEPEVLDDMLKFGFNLTTFNNNHTLDFSYNGLMRTIENVSKTGIVHAGVGMNIHQASAPAFLETENGRVALVSVSTSFNETMLAGEQSRRVAGRPGVNGIRLSRQLMVEKEDLEKIREIAEKTGINAAKNVSRSEGYTAPLPEGVCELGEMIFVEGDHSEVFYKPNKEDVSRLKKSIECAAMEADYVMVSIHSHQLCGTDKRKVPGFLEELARLCVDTGGDAVICHGPHLLRPIEVYKDKPIFYSLGDFVIQLYNVPIAPEDFYKKYGMNSDSPTIELLQKRSKNFTRGLMEDNRMLETVIPYWETDKDNKLTKLVLLPVKASKGEGKHLEGLPRVATDLGFIEELNRISTPYGVKIKVEDGLAVCEW